MKHTVDSSRGGAKDAQQRVFVIPEGVRRLRGGMLRDFEGLRKVVLPSTIEEVAGDPFAGCDSLEEVCMPAPVYARFADAPWMKRIEDLVDIPETEPAPMAEPAPREAFAPLYDDRREDAPQEADGAPRAPRPKLDWRRAPARANVPSPFEGGEAPAADDAPYDFEGEAAYDDGAAAFDPDDAPVLDDEGNFDTLPGEDDGNWPAADEDAKAREIERLNEEIRRLEEERDALKGIFSGMKRKKLQQEIIALKQQIDYLQDDDLHREGVLEDELMLEDSGEGLFPAVPDNGLPFETPEDEPEDLTIDTAGMFPAAPDDGFPFSSMDDMPDEIPMDDEHMFPVAPDDAVESPGEEKPKGIPWIRRK